MIIHFGGEEFLLHHSGALFWPSENMLIVSDLHLEKGSHYAKRGFFLPPYDSDHTLNMLLKICGEVKCKALLLLGDAFHDNKGYERLEKKQRALFNHLMTYNPVWIRGNHDRDFVPEGIHATDMHVHKGISFRHETSRENTCDISGHFHPKTDITNGYKKLARPCFIEDGNKMILPAFGAFTGGLYVSDPVIKNLFPDRYNVYALGQSRVFKI